MLKERITEAWKQAMRDKETQRKNTLSLLRSAIHMIEIEKQVDDLDDAGIIAVINKEISKRADAAEQYHHGGREDAALEEEQEATILREFLPTQISDEELDEITTAVIQRVGATQIKDMGRVMKEMTQTVAGRANNRRISISVREKLS